MKKYLLLLALVCLLGNRALAQDYQYAGSIDFHGLSCPDYGLNNNVVWDDMTLISAQGRSLTLQVDETRRVSLHVDQKEPWNIGASSEIMINGQQQAYFQNGAAGENNSTQSWKSVYIDNLKLGDRVRLTTNPGKLCAIFSNNTDKTNNGNAYYFSAQNSNSESNVVEFEVTSNGSVQIQCVEQYSGIHSVELWVSEQEQPEPKPEPRFDYDPGYEEYDMYDEFSLNNPKIADCVGGAVSSYTSYTTTPADFSLNGNTAQYITLSGSKITANNRIAIDRPYDSSVEDLEDRTQDNVNWRFNYGLRAPRGVSWANFSICNLREGDRVVFSYTGDAPVLSSVGNTATYNGCKAFADKDNDGVLDEDEEYIIPGTQPVVDWQRGEGAFYKEDYGCNASGNAQLYYTVAYTIAEGGHLDIGLTPNCRIVKIKIYSDHQAMMVDDYDNTNYTYTSYFNITGELQAKEHIVPGGLEVHVGNDDASQHAHVVSSKEGPVSIVNAVDGYKLPGMSRDNNNNLKFDFNIGKQVDNKYVVPSTGTYYRFKSMEDGIITLRIKGNSMNYYSYAIDGDAAYYGATSNYGQTDWSEQFDRPNEQTVETTNNENNHCPYYLMKSTDGGVTFTLVDTHYVPNGKYDTFEVTNAAKNDIYYVFGGWNATGLYFNGSGEGQNNLEYFPYGAGNGGAKKACGVAELLWVKFQPENKIYPLAKWVPNGTPAVDADNKAPKGSGAHDTTDEDFLAEVQGYVGAQITVKKMSGNIKTCHPYIWRANPTDNYGKLRIDNITFEEDKNPGGVILIKIGNPSDRNAPLYALTIAYSTDPKYDGENGQSGDDGRGHTWDLSTQSLRGLTWGDNGYPTSSTVNNIQNTFTNDNSSNSKYAIATDYSTYFADYYNESNISIINNAESAAEVQQQLAKNNVIENGKYKSLLYDEVTNHADWMFNYQLVYGGELFEPVFSNKYDMEGDNADMIWDTEGTVFQTSSNQSVIFNEYGKAVTHSATETADPNRFVGILEGGEFMIPWLEKNDRVIIYMGAGKGRYADEVKLSITNARDAVYNEISPNDEYILGGSHWDGKKGDPNYRGCYHFFAKENGHMVFKMIGGELCKIYKIQIYRGDRIITNEIVDKAATENQFLLYSTAADPNEDPSETNKDYTDNTTHEWALQYLGKDQQLANGVKGNTVNTNLPAQNNEIIAKTGKYSSETPALTNNLEVVEGETTSKVESFTYKHQLGEIGTFRMRGKDMEKNMNYVADYADHNVTIAYQETQPYPYTWDFMDMTGWGNNSDNFDDEDVIGDDQPADVSDEFWAAFGGSTTSKTYERTSRDLSLWEIDNDNNCYFLRLNSQAQDDEEDLMVQDNIFETATAINGNQLWVNGEVVPETQGLWFYTSNNDRHNGKWEITNNGMLFNGKHARHQTLVVPNVPAGAAVYLRMGASGDLEDCEFEYQFEDGKNNCEVYGNGPQQVGSSKEYIFAIQNNGTSKRKLILSIAGYRLKKLAVSKDPKTVNIKGYASESRNRVIDHKLTSFFTGKNIKAYLAKEKDANTISLKDIAKPMPAATADGQFVGSVLYNSDNANDTGEIKILDGGFHLFVPDMHDYTGDPNDAGNMKTGELESTSGNMMQSFNAGGKDSKKLSQTTSKNIYVLSYKYLEHDRENQATITGNIEAFYRLASSGANVKPNSAYIQLGVASTSQAKMSIVFEDELFGNQGITTSIDDAVEENVMNGKAEWYSLDGRKLNGVPTAKGLYIVNGKKVLVK